MSYQVLARKWRPRSFKEMAGQENILRMLINALDHQRLHHAYLFTGTRGVGKTTLARLLAKCLNCEKGISSTPCESCSICESIQAGHFLDLIEVDAASQTKVEDMRELLENIQYPPSQGRYKIYLIDEVHMLSGHSFNALLKTLEEPPSHVIFLLATTDPKRLPITILSRCLPFHLKCISVEAITKQLQLICDAEKINYDLDALKLIANAADGSMRDALSLLDQAITFSNQKITQEDMQSMLGCIDRDIIFHLLDALAEKDGKKLLEEIDRCDELAPDFSQLLNTLLSVLHQITIAQVVSDTMSDEVSIQQAAKNFSAEDIQLYYQIALIGQRDLSLAPNPRVGFEMILLRMLAFQPMEVATPVTPKSQPIPHSTKTPSSDWNSIASELNLSGLARALASSCTLHTIIDNKITLQLSENHKALLNKSATEQMNSALNQYFEKTMVLVIQITSDTKITTPFQQQQNEADARHAATTEKLKKDEQVQKMMHVFNATLDENSIKSIDP